MATKNDTVRIANDELEYEVIIIDPGFSTWLNSTALPRNYYSQSLFGKQKSNMGKRMEQSCFTTATILSQSI